MIAVTYKLSLDFYFSVGQYVLLIHHLCSYDSCSTWHKELIRDMADGLMNKGFLKLSDT